MPPNNPEAHQPLKDVVSAKEKEIQGEDTASIVTEEDVETAASSLDAKLEKYKLEGKYKEQIEGKLKDVKDEWRTKIKEIKEGGADALITATGDLIKELKGFTEQKEVKDVLSTIEPFFGENKASIIKAISFSKYKKDSGHWMSINTRFHALGINKARIQALQSLLKVDADGKIGPKTMTAMFAMYGEKKKVVFDDNDTVILSESGVADFEAYEEQAKAVQEMFGGFDEEKSEFKNPEWAKLEEEWAAKYTADLTLDRIIELRGEEKTAKLAKTKEIMDKAKEAAAAEEVESSDAVQEEIAVKVEERKGTLEDTFGMADRGDGSYLHTNGSGEITHTFTVDSEGGVSCVNEKTKKEDKFVEGEDSLEDWTQAIIDLGDVQEGPAAAESIDSEPEGLAKAAEEEAQAKEEGLIKAQLIAGELEEQGFKKSGEGKDSEYVIYTDSKSEASDQYLYLLYPDGKLYSFFPEIDEFRLITGSPFSNKDNWGDLLESSER